MTVDVFCLKVIFLKIGLENLLCLLHILMDYESSVDVDPSVLRKHVPCLGA